MNASQEAHRTVCGILAHSRWSACLRPSTVSYFFAPTLASNIPKTQKSSGFRSGEFCGQSDGEMATETSFSSHCCVVSKIVRYIFGTVGATASQSSTKICRSVRHGFRSYTPNTLQHALARYPRKTAKNRENRSGSCIFETVRDTALQCSTKICRMMWCNFSSYTSKTLRHAFYH